MLHTPIEEHAARLQALLTLSPELAQRLARAESHACMEVALLLFAERAQGLQAACEVGALDSLRKSSLSLLPPAGPELVSMPVQLESTDNSGVPAPTREQLSSILV
jgi:hypothetical protein